MALDDRNDPAALAGIGACAAFRAVVEQARELARIPRPILVRGERGTGKELMARFIHAASPRREAPYLIVNCGAFQDELLVSHLLGHEKGSFTGATERRVGVFEQALLRNALEDAGGNQREAAQHLGMTYDQFRHHYRKYGLGDASR